MLEDAMVMVVGIVLLVLIVLVVHSILLPPECAAMANATALAFANAIDVVANEREGIRAWDQDSVPPDSETDYYYPVAVRMCEGLRETPSAFVATPPSYQIVYETFPEGPPLAIWTESYPWSGGTAAALIGYGVIRYGPKIVTGQIFVSAVKTGGKVVKAPAKVAGAINRLKLWWQKVKISRELTPVTKNEGWLFKYSPKKVAVSGVGDIETYASRKGISEVEALQELKLVKKSDEFMPGQPAKYVVDPDAVVLVGGKPVKLRKVMAVARETMDDEMKKVFDDTFYIPSRWAKVRSFTKSFRAWKYSSKNRIADWYKRRWFYKNIHEPLKRFKAWAREGFNENFRPNYRPKDTALEVSNIRRLCVDQPDNCRFSLAKAMDDPITGPRLKAALSESKGLVVKSMDDVTDTEMIKFMNTYEKNFNMDPSLVGYAPRGSNPTTIALDNAGSEVLDEWKAVKFLDQDDEMFQYYTKSYNQLTPAEQEDFIYAISKGDPEIANNINAEQIWETRRYSVESAYSRENIFSHNVNVLDTEKFNKEYTKYSDMLLSSNEKVAVYDILVAERHSWNVLQKLKDPRIRQAWARTGRFLFIDMRGVIPTFELTPGAYSTKKAEAKMSDPDAGEGGCAWNSICAMGGGFGGAYSIPLNESTASYTVKLWRPKPSLLDRTPVFLQTAMFYNSVPEDPRFYVVSPCFGMGKVWKSGNTIYVTIQKCEGPSCGGCWDGQCANYCYADYDYIWGSNNDPSFWGHFGEWIGLTTWFTIPPPFGPGIVFQTAAKTAAWITIGTIGTETVAASTDDSWGYWNYYKAADICDFIDLAGSLGVNAVGKKVAGKQVGKGVVKAAAKSEWSSKMTDVCMAFMIAGDIQLSWPIRGINKACPLDAEGIKGKASACAWLICNNDGVCDSDSGETAENCPGDC